MKRVFLIGFLVVLAVLDWLALDDITTGNQPSYMVEYLFLFVSFLVFLSVVVFYLKRVN